MRQPAFALLLILSLSGCGDGGSPDGGGVDAPPGTDAGVSTDGGGDDAGSTPTDAGPPGDGGMPMVRCWTQDGPTLVVTRDAPSGGDEALLRLELGFLGGATGIVLDEVVEYDGGDAEVRRWDPAGLRPPDGFTGAAEVSSGRPEPRVVWTAIEPATPSELAVCEQTWYERNGGRVDVSGHTDAGSFEVSCGLYWSPAALDEQLRFACARGVPGWLPDAYDGISDIETPVDFVLMGTTAAAYGNAAAPITGFVATEVDVRSHLDTGFFGMCSAPMELWEPRGGTHTLWNGTSSTETWSGPIAPETIEDFHWDYQMMGDAPAGFCIPPDDGMTPPEETCPPPSLQFVVRGTSSAGPWEWESAAFTCYDLSGVP